jgi:hypothetical protein
MIDYERIKELQELVNKQTEDEGLWFHAKYPREAYLQIALRKLHALIEELNYD